MRMKTDRVTDLRASKLNLVKDATREIVRGMRKQVG